MALYVNGQPARPGPGPNKAPGFQGTSNPAKSAYAGGAPTVFINGRPQLTPQQVQYINAGMAAQRAAPPAATPQTPAASSNPLDPSYVGDSAYTNLLASATNAAQQRIANYNADIANARTNLGDTATRGTTLGNLAYNSAIAQQNAQLAENARGGFAQGILGQTVGRISQNALLSEQTAARTEGQQEAAWQQAISGVQQGMSPERIALALASAARQSALALQAPAPTPAPAAPAATPVTKFNSRGEPIPTSTAPERRSSSGGGRRGKR